MPIRIPPPPGASSVSPPRLDVEAEARERGAAGEALARGMGALAQSLGDVGARRDYRQAVAAEKQAQLDKEAADEIKKAEEELAQKVRQIDRAQVQVQFDQLDRVIATKARLLTDPEQDTFPDFESVQSELRAVYSGSRERVMGSIEDPDVRAQTEAMFDLFEQDTFPEVYLDHIENKKKFLESQREAGNEAIINQLAPASPDGATITGLGGGIVPDDLDLEVAAILAMNQGTEDSGGNALAELSLNRFAQFSGDEGRTLEYSLYVAANVDKWLASSTSAEADLRLEAVRDRAANEYRRTVASMTRSAQQDGIDLDDLDIRQLQGDAKGTIQSWIERKGELIEAIKKGAAVGLISKGEADAAENEFVIESGKVARVTAIVSQMTSAYYDENVQLELTAENEAAANMAWPIFEDQLEQLPIQGRVRLLGKMLRTFKGNAPSSLAQYMKNLDVGNLEDLQVLGMVMAPYVAPGRADPQAYPPDQRGWREPGPVLENDQLAAAAFMGDLLQAGVHPAQAAEMVLANKEVAQKRVSDPYFEEILKKSREGKDDPLSVSAINQKFDLKLDPTNFSHARYAATIQEYAEAQYRLGRTNNHGNALAAGRAFADKLYTFRNGSYEYLSPFRDNEPAMVEQDVMYQFEQDPEQFGGQLPTMDEVRFVPMIDPQNPLGSYLGPTSDKRTFSYMIVIERDGQDPILFVDRASGNPVKYTPDVNTSRATELRRIADAALGKASVGDIEKLAADTAMASRIGLASATLDVLGTVETPQAARNSAGQTMATESDEVIANLAPEWMVDEVLATNPRQTGHRHSLSIPPTGEIRAHGQYGGRVYTRDDVRLHLARTRREEVIAAAGYDATTALYRYDEALRLAYNRAERDANREGLNPSMVAAKGRSAVMEALTGTKEWRNPQKWKPDTAAKIDRLRTLKGYDRILIMTRDSGVQPVPAESTEAALTRRIAGIAEAAASGDPAAKIAAMKKIRALLEEQQ